ncbi:phage head-tail joining protein [Haematobacter missouriensis]
MTDWTETELSALRRAYASGTTRVSYDGKSVDYGSAEDLLARIRTIERAIAGTARPLPVAGLAGFSRGDRRCRPTGSTGPLPPSPLGPPPGACWPVRPSRP